MRRAPTDGRNAGGHLQAPPMARKLRSLWLSALVLLTLLVLAGCAKGAPQDSLRPAGPYAHKIDHLFFTIFWLAVVPVFVLVQGLVIVTVIKHRHRPGRPDPVQVHGNTKLEIGWTVAPVVILAAIGSFVFYKLPGITGPPAANAANETNIALTSARDVLQNWAPPTPPINKVIASIGSMARSA